MIIKMRRGDDFVFRIMKISITKYQYLQRASLSKQKAKTLITPALKDKNFKPEVFKFNS